MPDLEKVIRGLECCVWTDERFLTDCENCPYSNGRGCCNSLRGLHMDALALLKAQEQDSKKIIAKGNVYECPWCGEEVFIDTNPNYCGYCGKAVEWDG